MAFLWLWSFITLCGIATSVVAVALGVAAVTGYLVLKLICKILYKN